MGTQQLSAALMPGCNTHTHTHTHLFSPVCISAGIFGSSLLDSSPLPTPEPMADSDPGYHGNSTNPSSFAFEENFSTSPPIHSEDDAITQGPDHSTPAVTTSLPPASSSSQAPPTQPYTTPPDWLTSVTSLSTTWPIGTTSAPDSGI